MDKEAYILVQRICEHYEVERGFVESLHELELIRLKKEEDALYLSHDELDQLEKFMRLHRDLNINVEGLGVVSQLLEQVEKLKEEVNTLKRKLNYYEGSV